MKRLDIVYATPEHVGQFFGNMCFQRLKGYAAILNGEVIGVAGIRYDGDSLILFSDMKEPARKYKKDIIRMIRLMDELLENIKYPVLAIANKNESLSEKILIKLGFEYTGLNSPDGKVFRRA
jgi:hypothetical protein